MVLLACLFVAPALAQTENTPAMPPAADVLKDVAAAYQSLKTYQAQVTIQSVDGTRVAEQRFTETGSGASFRREPLGPQGVLYISDGQNEVKFDRGTNEYAKLPSPASAPALLGQFAQIDQNVKDATVDGEEVYSAGDQQVNVYIVELTRTSWPAGSPAGAQSVTYSIDEKTSEVYKSVTYTNGATQIALYRITQRNQPAPNNSFSFTPPASAKEVASLPAETANYKSILGMQAPDFTLKDVNGKSYKLSDYRGKVVVIDFVGSWCPPCLAQTPYIQQIFDSYPEKDLMVFGLDVGEGAKQVSEFGFNAAFSFPLLLGVEPDVTAQYFVDDYPTTYVIGRDGQIAFKATGTDNPGGFLAAVKNAVAKKN